MARHQRVHRGELSGNGLRGLGNRQRLQQALQGCGARRRGGDKVVAAAKAFVEAAISKAVAIRITRAIFLVFIFPGEGQWT